MGLYDMMMIKDNHIAAAGGIRWGCERHLMYLHQVQ
jgi:nicotinate-nucleotide pyrophosphorylase